MAWLSRFVRIAAVVALSIVLQGCSVRLVSDYDEQIDSGLTQFNTDLTVFVEKMIAASKTPAGTYASNQDFYVTEDAKLGTLIVRAEAHKALDSCPSVDAVQAAVKLSAPPATASTPSAIPLPDIGSVLAQVKNDDCSVALLNLIRLGLGQLKTFHIAQGDLGIPPLAHDPILVGGLGSLVRAALTVEIALKSGGSLGGKNGA